MPRSSNTSCRSPGADRILYTADAFRAGWPIERVYELSRIDPWFLAQIEDLIAEEGAVRAGGAASLAGARLLALKRKGFSDSRLARLTGQSEAAVRQTRHDSGIRPVYKRVDTCAAEFSTATAYMYSTYEEECEAGPHAAPQDHDPGRRAEPHRPGDRVSTTAACTRRSRCAEDGFETIMVNCNPETVSTDYDISDRLYFEPLTLEDVLEILDKEKPEGVIVQFGGQTPLKLSRPARGGGRADHRHVARFHRCRRGSRALPDPGEAARAAAAGQCERARRRAGGAVGARGGFSAVVRPSYVLGGRAWRWSSMRTTCAPT